MKKQNGITLISLIITIIVMLILAGVALSMVMGDGSVIEQANTATEETKIAEINDAIDLAIANNKAAVYSKKGMKTKNDIVNELYEAGKITSEQKNALENSDTITINGVVIDFSGINEAANGGGNGNFSFKMAAFEGDTYNELPLLTMTESFEVQSLEIKDSKLYAKYVLDDGTLADGALDIITQEYDYLDARELIGADTFVPSVLINSNYEVCDLESNLGADNYILFIITDASQIATLQSGNFYFDTAFWVTEWYDEVTKYNMDLVGTLGFYADISWYTIYQDGKDTIETSCLDSNFSEIEALVNELKKKEGAEITESDYYNWNLDVDDYSVYAVYGLFYEGCPVFRKKAPNYTLQWEHWGLFSSKTLYAADMESSQPNAVRNKELNENVPYSEFKADYDANLGSDNDDWLSKYEFYFEDKFHAIKNGCPIIF